MSRFGPRTKRYFRRAILYFSLFIFLVFLVGPFAWTLKSSFQTNRELIVATPNLTPHDPWWINYVELLSGGTVRAPEAVSAWAIVPHYVRWLPIAMVNTFIVAGVVAVLALVLGSISAYSISRIGFRGGNQLFIFYLGTRSIPSIAIIVPIYLLLKGMAMVDTLQGLILVDGVIVLPFAVWILREYFQTLPKDLDDAARIDGCSRLGVLFRIVYPISAPGLVATAIVAIMMVWNMFLSALILTQTTNSLQATVVAAMFINEAHIEYGLLNAASVIISLPPIVLALVFQKYIVRGLVAGAVKK